MNRLYEISNTDIKKLTKGYYFRVIKSFVLKLFKNKPRVITAPSDNHYMCCDVYNNKFYWTVAKDKKILSRHDRLQKLIKNTTWLS